MSDRKARKERPAILKPDPPLTPALKWASEHQNARLVQHLRVVAVITSKSYTLALLTLSEALTQPVSPARVEQLRRVADDLAGELIRVEDAMRELAPDADFDPSHEICEALLNNILRLTVKLAADYPVTGEDAAGLAVQLAEEGAKTELRKLFDALVLEAENPQVHGPALDVLLYGEAIVRADDREVDRAAELRAGFDDEDETRAVDHQATELAAALDAARARGEGPLPELAAGAEARGLNRDDLEHPPTTRPGSH